MKKRFHFLVTLPVLLVLGCTLFFFLLPSLADRYLFPRLLQGLPFTEKELSLSRLSPWRVRGTLTLADADRPTLAVPRFELTYTPRSLLQGTISSLLLDSASLQLEMQNGRPIIRGLPIGDSSILSEKSSSPLLLPLAVETIILKNCAVTVHRNQHKPITVLVDSRFSLSFLEQPANKKLLTTLAGPVQIRGDLLLHGDLALQSVVPGYEAVLQLQMPDIGQLSFLSPNLQNAQFTGGLSLQSTVRFSQSLDRIIDYAATVEFPRVRFQKDAFIFGNSHPNEPATLQLTGTKDTSSFIMNNIILAEPEKMALNLQGEITIPAGKFSGSGDIFFDRTQSALNLNFTGSHQQATTRINYALASEAVEVGDSFSCSPFKADGNILIDGTATTAELQGLIPHITLKKSETRLVNLSLHLPFQYPFPAKGTTKTAGSLDIEQIRYRQVNSGRLQATLLPSPAGIAFNTRLTTPFIPALQLTCDGSAQTTADISVDCRFPATAINSATFPRFLKLPDKLSFKGKLAADGQFSLLNKVPGGKLTLTYSGGTLNHGDNKLSDINFSVVFPHLPLLQSGPGQLASIGSLSFGKIKLSDARIRFRIEDEQSIFLEKVQADWCGGNVETGSFTLAATIQELDTTLYCDRLGFTELLAQFGIDETEGEGSLNGRLPMVINREGVIFDDGFLFSTPGNSGIVRFKDTRQLRQGMPDIGRSASVDYSMQALENFSYNWTKLHFNSRKNDLVIAMQLDGKPAAPLPFGYKNGQIVPSNRGPGIQHPIRLDVNFRFPMQDLLHYGKNIQSFMENM
jgi:hypothetical protein